MIPSYECTTFCVSFSVWWALGLLLLSGCYDNAAVNILGHFCVTACFQFSWNIPRSGIAGYVITLFKFLRNCALVIFSLSPRNFFFSLEIQGSDSGVGMMVFFFQLQMTFQKVNVENNLKAWHGAPLLTWKWNTKMIWPSTIVLFICVQWILMLLVFCLILWRDCWQPYLFWEVRMLPN